jgi:hypothetical protein
VISLAVMAGRSWRIQGRRVERDRWRQERPGPVAAGSSRADGGATGGSGACGSAKSREGGTREGGRSVAEEDTDGEKK